MANDINRIGFWTALAASIASALYSIEQLMQVAGVLKFPWDSILIYSFSLLIPVPLLIAMLALHYSVPQEKKFFTHGTLLFTIMYATYVSLNYVVQLATVIPNTLGGNWESIRILDQTPHSLFWDVDALGYISLGLATLLAFFALEKEGISRWTRRFFLANALMNPVIAVVYFYPTFSYALLMLASPWMVTATGSMLFLDSISESGDDAGPGDEAEKEKQP